MKNKTSALVVMIAVLLAGFLLGVAGLHFWQKKSDRDVSLLLQSQSRGVTHGLVEQLQLTSEQQTQLRVILEDLRHQINEGSAEMERKLATLRDQANAKIVAMLNDEQKKKFEQILSESETRRDPAGRRGDSRGHDRNH
jgi:Spy/CpxP family protein refolding chaperone